MFFKIKKENLTPLRRAPTESKHEIFIDPIEESVSDFLTGGVNLFFKTKKEGVNNVFLTPKKYN